MDRQVSTFSSLFCAIVLCAYATPAKSQQMDVQACLASPGHVWNGYQCMALDPSPNRCVIRVPAGVTPRCVEGSGRTAGPGWWYIWVGGQRSDWNEGTDAKCATAQDAGDFKVGAPVPWGVAPCIAAHSQEQCQRLLDLLGWCVEGRSVQDRLTLRQFLLSQGTVPNSERTASSNAQRNKGSEPVSYKTNRNPSPEDTTRGITSQYRCLTKEMSLEQNPDEFVLFNPHAGIVYPGSLIAGKTFATGGSMTPINVRRGPGVVTLALVTGAGTQFSRQLAESSFPAVNQAMNDVLRGFSGKTPAKTSYTMKQIFSQEHLAAEMQANVSGVNFDVGSTLSVRGDEETTRMLMTLRQEYFTMVFSPPNLVEDFFAPGITIADLQGHIGPDNPVVYVASVTYGRQLFLLFESRQSSQEMMATLKGSYDSVVSADASARAEYRRTLGETTVQSFALGGSASGALGGAAGVARDGIAGLDAMWRFIIDDANFSVDSPGYPISYKLANMADHRPLRLSTTTQYTMTQCELVKAGCDGVEGSTKVVDACGACGGGDACKRPCPAKTVEFGNDHAFIWIDLPQTESGRPALSWDDVGIYKYVFPRCYRVKIEDLTYTCAPTARGGEWRRSGEIIRDANCIDSGNRRQGHLRVGTK